MFIFGEETKVDGSIGNKLFSNGCIRELNNLL